MSDCTSSEDDPFDDAVDTLDPDPDISLLALTYVECSQMAVAASRTFKAPSPIHAFFAKAGRHSKHKGVILLTTMDYRSIHQAHTRQATIIDKLQANFKSAVSAIDNLKADNASLRGCFTSAIHLNHDHTVTIDKLKVEHTATSDRLKANLQTAVTASLESNVRATALSRTLADVTATNDCLWSELTILLTPTPTSSAATQTDPITTPPTTSTSAQTIHTTVDAASQTAPVSVPTTGDAATQTDFVATVNKPIPAAHLPSVSQPTSYAQATKANISLSHATAHATPHTTATPPTTVPIITAAPSSSLPFKGRRGTKASEIHLQLSSRADFNDKLHTMYGQPIIHRHALKDAFTGALNRTFELRCRRTHKGKHGSLREIFRNNPIDAVFWSPQGNLIVRAKKAINPVLLELITFTIQHITGRNDSFVILHCPPLLMLKLTSFPTTLTGGQPTDPEQILMDLFDDPRLKLASFWHTLRSVTYKGAPPGTMGTVFFSVIDSPNHTLGRSLVNTPVNIYDHPFMIQQWHARHTEFPALPHSRIYKT
jgi:hypothetical protein